MDASFLHEFEGLQFMPVKANKAPIHLGWQNTTRKYDLSNCEAVGLVCGKLSGGVEVIDVDVKYDLTGKLYENLKKLIHKADPSLLEKLVVQKTKSGGFHFIYRCSVVAGNTNLARRATTENEKDDTYKENYEKELNNGKSEKEARSKAEKARENDKFRVLVETRGIGGQIVCFPSPGYELLHRDFYGIMEITPEEREVIHTASRSLNEYVEQYEAPKMRSTVRMKGLSPFDDYNQRGDVVGLLESHGWKVVNTRGKKTHLLRPGQTTAQTSGNFDHDRNWFSVFSTSTEFENEKAYLPYAVFAFLECNKDFTEAYKRLYDLGFGDRQEEKKKDAESTRVIKSRINPEENDLSFLATPVDYDSYLQQVRDGTLPMGLSTGSPYMDKHFLFKKGSLVMVNGIDNVGKSVWMWWLLMLAAMYHGWRGIIFSSENTLGAFMRKMIQFYWGKPLVGKYAMSASEYETAKKFVEKHFKLIKAQEDLYNYKDIINMVKITMKTERLDYGLIDPYNSLKIDLSGFSKLNTHEYHYEAFSELKAFGQQNNFGWFVNHHAVTNAARAKDGEKKYPVAPGKADTEGGQKVANKADEFLTIHRITQHPTEWMVTELHVRKIKDTETGGKPTPLEEPVKFEMYKGGCAFIERLDGFGEGKDPVEEWHRRKNNLVQSEMPIASEEHAKIRNMWTPFKDDEDIFD